jgi:hypothetical protein
MKRNKAAGFDQRKQSATQWFHQFLESGKDGHSGSQFAMAVFWLLLGGACAALGCVLFVILLR